MSMLPFISICIPAYKRVDYLKRLLDSVVLQHYRDFEVIVTDDSPSDNVRLLCREYEHCFSIRYHKNEIVKETPENWNEAIRHAKGQWIKLMHDDDWFASPDSLSEFAKAAEKAPAQSFFYAAYQNVYEVSGKKEIVRINQFRKRKLEQDPIILIFRNIIGPPSVIMHKNDGKYWYDPRMKWLVDIDMYIRRLKDDRIVYLPEALINIGIGEDQVTASVHNNPEVQIPEHFYFLEKTGIGSLANILVYDYWWRFFRNFSLLSPDDILKSGYNGVIHPVMQSMMRWQKKLPRIVLETGLLSKFIMFIHFCLHRQKLVV